MANVVGGVGVRTVVEVVARGGGGWGDKQLACSSICRCCSTTSWAVSSSTASDAATDPACTCVGSANGANGAGATNGAGASTTAVALPATSARWRRMSGVGFAAAITAVAPKWPTSDLGEPAGERGIAMPSRSIPASTRSRRSRASSRRCVPSATATRVRRAPEAARRTASAAAQAAASTAASMAASSSGAFSGSASAAAAPAGSPTPGGAFLAGESSKSRCAPNAS